MIDFNKLINEGWSFDALDVEDYYALRPELKKLEEMPGCYAIAISEIGTPTFERLKQASPTCYYATRGIHPQHGDVFIFGNANDEGYILVNTSISDLLEELGNGG
ncbi:hypothetical protein M1D80_09560 [Phyllobacteriaceae bacterium JZ32]